MKNFRTSLKKHYKFIIFLCVLFIIGLVRGLGYFNVINDNLVIDLEKELLNINFAGNNLVSHVIILGILLFTTFLIFGVSLGLFIYFYEVMSIGFIIGAFFNFFNLSGLFYGIIYALVFKGLYLLLFSYLLLKLINVSKNIVGYFVLRKENNLKISAINNFVIVIFISVIILVNDIILILIGDKIMSIFTFLI